jgi:hypothetical protein
LQDESGATHRVNVQFVVGGTGGIHSANSVPK